MIISTESMVSNGTAYYIMGMFIIMALESIQAQITEHIVNRLLMTIMRENMLNHTNIIQAFYKLDGQ